MSPGGKRAALAVGVAAVLVAVGLGVARLVVARSVGSLLAERGLVCEDLDLVPGWDLGSVEVSSTPCLVARGERIREVGLPYGARVLLDGLRPTHVRIPELTVELDGEADLGALSAAFVDGSVPEPLERALQAIGAASARGDLPSLHIETARIRQGEQTLTVRGIAAGTDGTGLHATVASVEPPSHHGLVFEIEVVLETVTVLATPDAVRIEGTISLAGRIGPREMSRRAALDLNGLALREPSPVYELVVDGGADLETLRATLEALGARRADRTEGGAPARPGARLGELADRLEEMRERMEERSEPLDPPPPPP